MRQIFANCGVLDYAELVACLSLAILTRPINRKAGQPGLALAQDTLLLPSLQVALIIDRLVQLTTLTLCLHVSIISTFALWVLYPSRWRGSTLCNQEVGPKPDWAEHAETSRLDCLSMSTPYATLLRIDTPRSHSKTWLSYLTKLSE